MIVQSPRRSSKCRIGFRKQHKGEQEIGMEMTSGRQIVGVVKINTIRRINPLGPLMDTRPENGFITLLGSTCIRNYNAKHTQTAAQDRVSSEVPSCGRQRINSAITRTLRI